MIANGIMPLKWQHYVSVLLFGFFTMLDLRKNCFRLPRARLLKSETPPPTPE
jgi:hypothetical protein